MDPVEMELGVILQKPYVKLALMTVVILMLGFLAAKSGFSLWVMNRFNLSKERLSGPPGSAAQALSAYDRAVLSGDLYN